MPHTVGQTTSSTAIDANDRTQPVVARIAQGYETKINIQLLPGRGFDPAALELGCRPRRGASRREADPVPLPADLVEKLRNGNDKVMTWLNTEPANAQLFLARPVEALMKAGVELSRAEQKMILRTFSENNEAIVLGQGVRVNEVTVVANPGGRVGGPKPGPGTKSNREPGCGFTRKGKE